ncbi:aryl-alcohol dehydrogenase-like predicted oxidoreductase [Phyllobacterium trifolii]|uniref:Aryl-alcohol dehydrogenase-like predicted oxidoreductase n=1 Tax=Phyllobacterium trifolii TaxID=300193 RepID=A0A839UBR6_9HYPH|nr:aldo/keto reductase [Phyllobacterium trifolii]MBB3148418.1 aryl-alcohol dehydrogenase-like predicted oxidoreductase [Phyllobacterium trifolii]
MKYNTLGNTGLFVSELCLGTMTFGGKGVWANMGNAQQDGAQALIARVLEHGINFIDTADIYSSGTSEEMVGQSLKTLGVRREDVVIATKVLGPMGQGPNDAGNSRGHIFDSVKASLKRLQIDHIDLYQLHNVDNVTPIEESLAALDALVQQGLVRYVGVSYWSAWQMARALGHSERLQIAKIATSQNYYTLAGRDIEREIVPLIKAEILGLLVWSPLAGGLLSGKFGRDKQGEEGSRRTIFDFPPVALDRAYDVIDVMERIGVSVARIALAWLLHQAHVTSVIVGAKTVAQLDDSAGASEVTLSADEVAELEAVSRIAPEYPAWMQRTREVAPRPPLGKPINAIEQARIRNRPVADPRKGRLTPWRPSVRRRRPPEQCVFGGQFRPNRNRKD